MEKLITAASAVVSLFCEGCVKNNCDSAEECKVLYNLKTAINEISVDLFNKAIEALILTLNTEYSYVFFDDYIIPLDSGSPEEIIIRLLEKIKNKSWKELQDIL